jgi:UDP-N-acetylmuramate dehydrogenase
MLQLSSQTALANDSSVASSPALIQSKVSLAGMTSFKVGGLAEWYAAPRTVDDVADCLDWAQDRSLPVMFLGAGSNLLISDAGLPGLVISSKGMRQLKFDLESGQVTASAGEPLPRLAWEAARRGIQGMEWAVGIPGTVGGSIVMNAGAHGGCMADSLVSVRLMGPSGIEVWTLDQMAYRYRTSILQGNHYIVLDATFQLRPGADSSDVMAFTSQNLDQRKASQPYHLPSCGSVFRNPEPLKAGQLIQQSGLKGYRVGNAEIAERHANFILNCGGATAMDIFQIIRHTQAVVLADSGVKLEPEVKLLGEFPTI